MLIKTGGNWPMIKPALSSAVGFVLVAALVAGPVGMLKAAPPSAAEPPLMLVKQLVSQVLGIVKDKEMAQADKAKKLRELGAAHFDFDRMSRSALGPSWKSLKAGQRKQFTAAFTSFLEDAYLDKVQNYSDQEIQIANGRFTEKDYAEVSGKVIQHESEPIALGFSLRRNNGVWKIYDVAVDNVSTLVNYRTQFQRILREKSFDDLMKQIKERDRELASTLGSPTGLPF